MTECERAMGRGQLVMSPCVLRRHLTPFLYLRAPPIIMDNLACVFRTAVLHWKQIPFAWSSFIVRTYVLYIFIFRGFLFLASTQPSHCALPISNFIAQPYPSPFSSLPPLKRGYEPPSLRERIFSLTRRERPKASGPLGKR